MFEATEYCFYKNGCIYGNVSRNIRCKVMYGCSENTILFSVLYRICVAILYRKRLNIFTNCHHNKRSMVLFLTIAMRKKVWWHSSAKNIFDTESRFVSLLMRACACT